MPECGFLWVPLESFPVISVQQIPDRCVLLRNPFTMGWKFWGILKRRSCCLPIKLKDYLLHVCVILRQMVRHYW